MERKLAAILCADVYGYSRLMGDNEEATVRTLTCHSKTIDSAIEQHRGRFVNSAGDSVLAEFASVVGGELRRRDRGGLTLRLLPLSTDNMKHKAVDSAFALLYTRPAKRRAFHFARPLLLAAAGSALALALVAPGFTGSACAQTMGEYGGVTAQSAGAASSMPKIGAPSLGRQTNSPQGNYSGSQRSEETRTYEPHSNDRSRDDRDNDQRDDSPRDWEQVK
jgi:hypothetical protein